MNPILSLTNSVLEEGPELQLLQEFEGGESEGDG